MKWSRAQSRRRLYLVAPFRLISPVHVRGCGTFWFSDRDKASTFAADLRAAGYIAEMRDRKQDQVGARLYDLYSMRASAN